MKNSDQLKKLSLTAVMSLIASNSFAINGVYDYGMGQINRGMGGAGVAWTQDAFATFTNPAGLNQISHNLDAGIAIYFPDMYSKFSAGTAAVPPPTVEPIAPPAGRFDSKVNIFALPDISYVYHYDKNNHFGVSVNAVGGFGSKYHTDKNATTVTTPPIAVVQRHGLFGDGTVVSKLNIASINASYNYVVDKYFSWGITASHYIQAFESKGSAGLAGFTTIALLNPGSNATLVANKLSNNGTDYNNGFGFTVGAMIKPHPMVTLGATATPTVRMSKMTKYRHLHAENGRLDIPGRYVAGVRFQPNDKLDIITDVVRIMNREVATYGNNSRAFYDGRCAPGALLNAQYCMGGKKGVGFGWSNQTLVKVGGAYKLTSRDTVRLGVSYGNRIGHEKDIVVQVFAPGSAAQWITSAGYSREMPNYKLNSFLTYIPNQTLKGVNELSANSSQTVEVKVGGFGLGLGISV